MRKVQPSSSAKPHNITLQQFKYTFTLYRKHSVQLYGIMLYTILIVLVYSVNPLNCIYEAIKQG